MLKPPYPWARFHDLHPRPQPPSTGAWSWYVNARLPMLISISGCLSSSILFLVSMTSTSSSSASSHRHWFCYVDARLFMLISILRCSSTSPVFLVAMTCFQLLGLLPPALIPAYRSKICHTDQRFGILQSKKNLLIFCV